MEALQKRQEYFHHLKENHGFQIIFFKLSLSKRKQKSRMREIVNNIKTTLETDFFVAQQPHFPMHFKVLLSFLTGQDH